MSVVASRIIEAVAWVSAWRTSKVSLVTREIRVPVGWRSQHGGHSYCAGHTDEVGHLLSQRPWLPHPRNRSVFAPLPALASLHPLDSYRLYHADRSPVDPKWRAFTHWLQRQADRDSVNESTVDRSSTV